MSQPLAGSTDLLVRPDVVDLQPPGPGDGVTAGEPAGSPRFRLVTLMVVVGLFLVGQLAGAVGPALVGELSTSAFLYVGPGVVACAFLPPLPTHVHALLSIVGGASVVVLVATLFALTGLSLDLAWVGLAILVLAGAAWAGVRDVRALRRSAGVAVPPTPSQPATAEQPPPAGEADSSERNGDDEEDDEGSEPYPFAWAFPGVIAVAGTFTALASAAAHRRDPAPVGAAVSAGPLWFLGVALVLIALGLAWAPLGRSVRPASLAVPVLALTSVVVASQGLMYREPAAVVASRHIGLVDYVLAFGRLDRSTDIYQAWAGLFAAAALNVRAAGIEDLFGYATWWGVLATPVLVLAVRTLAGRFLDTRRAWLAGLVFGLGSSLTTSFFAPQVLGFAMALTVLALLAGPPGMAAVLPRRAGVGVVLVIDVANALTHQLSPYLLGLALITLAFFRLVSPRWAFALALVPALVWALVNRHLLTGYLSLDAVGRLFANLAPPDHSVGAFPVPLANRLAFGLPAVALVVIGLVAMDALVRRRDRVAWGLAAAAASPVVLMGATAYGQEGIFRVALFALPWLAVLACLPRWRPFRFALPAPTLLGGVAITLLLVVDVIGLTAMDWARVIRSGDVAAAQWVERNAPRGAAIMTLGTDLTIPENSVPTYADTDWVSRTALYTSPRNAFPTTTGPGYDAAGDLANLTARLTAMPASAYYAVAADSTGAYDQRYGNQRAADHQQLSEAIARSDQWQQVFTAPGVVVYTLRQN